MHCGKLESFKAPKATEVDLSYCGNLKSFEAPDATEVILLHCGNLENCRAPNAMKVNLISCAKLESFEAPKATEVNLSHCHELKSFEAPNATQIVLRNPPKDLVDTIIRQLNNPQTLTKFEVDGKDIAQDIKNADRELNGSADAQIKRANIARNGIRYGDISENPSINKETATKFNNTDGVSLIG